MTDSPLNSKDPSTRLRAVLAIGTSPDPNLADALVRLCEVEPDFYVRDMLTWALTRIPKEIVVPKLLVELQSEVDQARSQALHTLSKIKAPETWPAITRSLLRDPNDEVARSAWRAAVVLVPDTEKKDLAQELGSQLGRGGREVQLSLSLALIALGKDAIQAVLTQAKDSNVPAVRIHASATERILQDPDAGFDSAIHEAKRIFILGKKE